MSVVVFVVAPYDVIILTKSIPVSLQALRKRMDDWNSSDPTFKQLQLNRVSKKRKN